MNRLNKTESAIFELWMLYCQRISLQIIYTAGRFMFGLALCFVCVSFVLCSILITLLGEEGAGLCASRAFVLLHMHMLIYVLFLFLLVSAVGSDF